MYREGYVHVRGGGICTGEGMYGGGEGMYTNMYMYQVYNSRSQSKVTCTCVFITHYVTVHMFVAKLPFHAIMGYGYHTLRLEDVPNACSSIIYSDYRVEMMVLTPLHGPNAEPR